MTWPIVPFQDLYAIPSRNGLTRPKRVRGVGYKMVNMGELFAHGRIHDIAMERVPMNETEIDKFSLDAGDLLFARQSLIREGAGKCSIVMHLPEITCFESHIIRTRLNLDKAHPLFYYYYFSSSQGHGNVQSLVNQVAAAGIRGSELATLKIPLPPLPVQRKIAAILSAYDDLIENNRRRIAILEEMARNLYREWFVKFRFPLFRDDGTIERIHDPERDPMQDSPLGPIPHGWEVKTLVDVADLTMGQSPKSDFYNTDGEGLPFHQGVTDFGTRYPRNRVYSTEGTRKAYQGDILFSVRAPVGRINISTCTMILGRGLAAIRSIDGKQTFLYHQLDHMFQEEDIIGNGAIFKAVTKKDMQTIKLTQPPSVLADAFECYATPIFNIIGSISSMNENLALTRDHLLPKLISGQVDVSGLDIEIPVETIS